MPNIDPDPFSPWSSSSEASISQTNLCWWRTGFPSKTIKSCANLTHVTINKLNIRSDPPKYCPYYQRVTDGTSLLPRQQLAGTIPEKCPERGQPSSSCSESIEKPDRVPLMRRVNLSTPLVDMGDEKFKWARMYQPKALEDFICHRKNAEMLSNLVKTGHIDHFIFEGPPGVGKRTMIMAFLREYYGWDNTMFMAFQKTKEELKKFMVVGGINCSIQTTVRVSIYHIEIDVSELREHVMYVMMQLMKETSNIMSNQKNWKFQHRNHRVIVLRKAETLSKGAQFFIQSLMESYGSHNKVIFCCSTISKLFKHLRPLCTVVQLLPPSNLEIVEVLHFISNKAAIELPNQVAQRIAENSNYSLRQAIRSFEATWQLNYDFKENQLIITGWEEEIALIAEVMINEQSLKQLYNIRRKLVLLMEYNVSPKFIFDTLVEELKKHLTEDSQSATAGLFKQYYNREIVAKSSNNGDDQLLRRSRDKEHKRFHDPVTKNVHFFMTIEEFVAEFMSVYKFFDRKKRGQQNYVVHNLDLQ